MEFNFLQPITTYEIISIILSLIAIIVTIINLTIYIYSRKKHINLDILGYSEFEIENKRYLLLSLFIANKSILANSISRISIIKDKKEYTCKKNKVLLFEHKTTQIHKDTKEVVFQNEYNTFQYPIRLESYDISHGYIIFEETFSFDKNEKLTLYTSRGIIKKKIDNNLSLEKISDLVISDIRSLHNNN